MENTNQLNKEAWDAYQDEYFKFHLMARPDYFAFFSNGGVDWQGEEHMLDMIGNVKGLKLLDTCCACDAIQALSWHNSGAIVTACDITPKAIEIASANAAKMNVNIEFIVEDMQTLTSVGDNQFDIVFATYPVWIQDLNEACRNWHRVLKPGGKLLLNMDHPVLACIEADENGLIVSKDYNHPKAEREETFDGTGISERFGGWSVDLACVCNRYRISDILNAICGAGFIIHNTHESNTLCATEDVAEEVRNNIYLSKLPSGFTVLAYK
ncbi:MAG: class I SAM-dependent methyltransferase [Oscillospiraceae bacterium]|nr:class I SAM-dependent methyltransferase [Oscillospiraceae bacterium]